MTVDQLLKKVKSRLEDTYGDRFRGAVLYGSEARGDGSPDSDIDVLVLLRGPIRLWEDISTITDALYPLQLEADRPLSAIPADSDAYEAQDRSLYQAAKREGIQI